MANKIRVLPELTINQIAAGEVIENPASVVKELVENAIDSGATHVCIEIQAGGFQWIKVGDDGCGMSPDDAVLCLERHATSKIVAADDLFDLTTMGFRGEALASIAAISKMTLVSALENAPAVTLDVEGGKILHVGPAARSRGTGIEVRSLFFNVPARKKFQKSASASSAEITKIVTQLALAHPEIGVELIQQGRTLFSLPASSGEDFLVVLRRRAHVLLGEEFVNATHDLGLREKEYGGMGLIAGPVFSRHNRSGQYLFVNRRPVFCLPIAYAIRDAYGTRLSSDRHPVYLLHLSIPSSQVDVNVHPQKKEIRLREESFLKCTLHSAVNAALGSAGVVSAIFTQLPNVALPDRSWGSSFAGMSQPDFSMPLVCREEMLVPSHPEMPLDIEMHIIGLYRHYLLVEAESFSSVLSCATDGVVWVDLPAVEARIQFDSMVSHAEKHLVRQCLLLPLTLSFSRAEAQLLKGNQDVVQQLGLEMREIAESVFLIEAIPPFLEEAKVRGTIEALMSELQGLERDHTGNEERLRRLAACVSRQARSRKKCYTLEEARHLIKQLIKSSDLLHCPQGKLMLFHVKEDAIEDYFK